MCHYLISYSHRCLFCYFDLRGYASFHFIAIKKWNILLHCEVVNHQKDFVW